MVKFLIQRPIAVLMAFTACFIVGLVTYWALPVSLLPDIDIPQVTVQMTSENASAREMENTMVAPVRRALLQVSGLEEMKSETRDGSGVIHLSFEFGTNTDLAFIEVNEKIDAAMNSLPKDLSGNGRAGFPEYERTGGKRGAKTHRTVAAGSYGGYDRCARTDVADCTRYGKNE